MTSFPSEPKQSVDITYSSNTPHRPHTAEDQASDKEYEWSFPVQSHYRTSFQSKNQRANGVDFEQHQQTKTGIVRPATSAVDGRNYRKVSPIDGDKEPDIPKAKIDAWKSIDDTYVSSLHLYKVILVLVLGSDHVICKLVKKVPCHL